MIPARAVGSDRLRRAIAAAGAVTCALAIVLGAAAAHVADEAARTRLDPAASYLLAHGLALALLAPRQSSRLELWALLLWILGSVLFCGSLVLSVASGIGAPLAPVGGVLLIVGWLLQAGAMLQRRTTWRESGSRHPHQ